MAIFFFSTGPSFTVTIQHSMTSNLRHVGLQVWKAQLLLSEFVLHKICTSSEFHGIVCHWIMDTLPLLPILSCFLFSLFPGLLGILLARVAKAVFLTDHGDAILANCAKNLDMNSSLFHPHTVVNLRELNWMSDWPIEDNRGDCRDPENCVSFLLCASFCWSKQDFEQVKCASFIFAADVIYSDDLTIALFSMLRRVMSFGCDKVLYLGLEKRYNFSLDDLNIVANGYTCFRS
ncbi:unnamed protein product [Arabidopsis halleri]